MIAYKYSHEGEVYATVFLSSRLSKRCPGIIPTLSMGRNLDEAFTETCV